MSEKSKVLSNSIDKFYYMMSVNELKYFNDKSYTKVSYNTSLYLNIISTKENCTASFIAEQIGVSKAAVTMKLNELIEKGLIIKEQNDLDKRINYLYLCDTIKKEFDEYDKKFELIIEEVQSKYSQEEIEIFCKILNDFSKNN